MGERLFTTSPQAPASTPSSSCCQPLGRNNGPPNAQAPFSSVDTKLAKEMYELSVAERERLFDDIHGVAHVVDETPEFVRKRLQEFDKALASIPAKKRQNVTRAYFLRPKLETETGFRLMFLRADNFNAREAAQRMVRYLNEKVKLFGADKIVKTITINDLDESDLQVLQDCPTAILPFKDQSGRPIMFGNGTKIDLGKHPIRSHHRTLWYNCCSTWVDEMAQKTGLIAVIYSSRTRSAVAGMKGKAPEFMSQGGSLVDSLPCRFCSMHWCYDSPGIDLAVNALRLAYGKSSRLRLRPHFGSEIENEYKLVTYGIRAEGLFQGALHGEVPCLTDYIEYRRTIDNQLEQQEAEEEAASGIIAYPKPTDILFGRGQPFREFSGNLELYKLVDANLETYVQAQDRFEKTCLTMNIVKRLQDKNARFLERVESSGWRVVDDTVAREKMAITFRSRVKALSVEKKTTVPRGCQASNSHVNNKRPRYWYDHTIAP